MTRAIAFGVLILAACGSDDPGSGGTPSAVHIVASEGGIVRSSDGIFRLEIPPGALAEDTDISITIVPRGKWPEEVVDAPPLAALYDIEPDGLVFSTPARGIHTFETAPADLVGEDGSRLLAAHAMRSSDGTLELAPTGTISRSDGRVAVTAQVSHTSEHWATSRLFWRGHYDLRVALVVEAEAGEHAVGESWSASRVELVSNVPVAVDSHTVVGEVLTPASERFHIRPLVPAGWTSETVIQGDFESSFPDAMTAESEDRGAGSIDILTPLTLAPPLPGWTCVSSGENEILVGGSITGSFEGGENIHLWNRVSIGIASCTGRAAPLHDHILVGSACRIGSGGGCDPVTSGSIASVQRLPDAERERCAELTPGVTVCEGATGGSEPGPDPLTLTTGEGATSAPYDEGARRYVPELAPSVEAFGPTDALRVEGVPAGGSAPAAVDVQAPEPIESLEDIFSEIDGVSSTVEPRPGETHPRLVIAELTGATEPARLYRLIPGGTSEPILDDATIAALGSRGLAVSQVTVGPISFVEDSALFGAPMLVAAGRFVMASPSDLAPPVTPGGVVVRDCSELPFDFTEITGRPGELGVLCIDAAGGCFVSNDVQVDLPPLPSQCSGEERAAIFLFGGATPTANAGDDIWELPWTSAGTDTSGSASSPPADTDSALIVERSTDGARWRVDHRITAGGIHIESVAPFTGVLPPWGAAYDARDTPRTFTSSYAASATAQVFVRVCSESTGLYLFGNTDATPEEEHCRSPWRFAVALITNDSGALLDVSHPGGSEWVVTSTSHGTLTSGNVTGLPTGVDVTTRIDSSPTPGIPFEIVYQYTGGGFVVQSVTEL